jgi:hypothetical protein
VVVVPEDRRSTDALAAIRAASSLADLSAYFETDSEHEAYLEAKDVWRTTIEPPVERTGGLSGTLIELDGTEFWIHGVTHAGSDAEGGALRAAAETFLGSGAAIYCEQGIRRLYFQDYDSVCEMDDYRWAMAECRELEIDSHIEQFAEDSFEDLTGDIEWLADQFRDVTFSLIQSGRGVFGDRFARALGDVASTFTSSHADLATREEYEAFALSRRAAKDPSRLEELQRYYHRSFLPQPLEREWLRRHDPELEIMTHARNERMAEYVLSHHETAPAVHLVVGAAHQPGIAYYLTQYRDREWVLDFEPVD